MGHNDARARGNPTLKGKLENVKDVMLQISNKLKKAAKIKKDQNKKGNKGKMNKDTKSKKEHKQDKAWQKIPPKP